MPISVYNISEFHDLVRGMIREAVRQNMLQEFDSADAATSASSTGTASGTSTTSGTSSGNKDPFSKLTVPGTGKSVDDFLSLIQKETNPQKKGKMLSQVAGVANTLQAIMPHTNQTSSSSVGSSPILEEEKGHESSEHDSPWPELSKKIKDYIAQDPAATDSEILFYIKPDLEKTDATPRWVRFMAKMVRGGLAEE